MDILFYAGTKIVFRLLDGYGRVSSYYITDNKEKVDRVLPRNAKKKGGKQALSKYLEIDVRTVSLYFIHIFSASSISTVICPSAFLFPRVWGYYKQAVYKHVVGEEYGSIF